MRDDTYPDGDWIIEVRVWRLPRPWPRLIARTAPTFTAADAYGTHAPTCAREIRRHADDSAAYLSEPCTCGAAERTAR